MWTIRLTKSYLKFSAAHMTVYPDGTKEPLHGHNYQVHIDLDINDASFAKMIDFNRYKDLLRSLCDDWDEMILIQGNNPLVSIVTSESSVEVKVCAKEYVFPRDEVHILKIENITSELLAKEMARLMVEGLKAEGLLNWESAGSSDVIDTIRLGVFETAGQGASYLINREIYKAL